MQVPCGHSAQQCGILLGHWHKGSVMNWARRFNEGKYLMWPKLCHIGLVHTLQGAWMQLCVQYCLMGDKSNHSDKCVARDAVVVRSSKLSHWQGACCSKCWQANTMRERSGNLRKPASLRVRVCNTNCPFGLKGENGKKMIN